MPAAPEHVPLDQSTRQIRLLRFVGLGAGTAPIHCRLATYNLDHRPSFVALSYTWGDAQPCREIILNGEVFLLRQNLHSALLVLREKNLKQGTYWNGHLYWIDAICINQQDDSERSHQVNMMGSIYSEACFVLVWLGPGGQALEEALKEVDAYRRTLPSGSQPLALKKLKSYIERSGIKSSAYWERMWVIQEFTLAQDVCLLQGHSMLHWEELKSTLGLVGNVGSTNRLVDCRIRWEHKYAFTTSGATLDLLICMFESSKCSDVRDRVYALLSLVGTQSDDSKPLYPDYTISPWQLYYRVLSNVRQSPSLRNTADWHAFRARLCNILVLPRDEVFERNDFLYCVSEIERPDQKPLLSLHPDHRARLGHALLKDVAEYLHWPPAHVEREPQHIYKDVIQSFQHFPKEEDPEAWNCFDKLLKEVLGLWSTTSEDSEMWNTFIDFPG